ncbi:LytR/AlgR family response regulator transcription factor [Maribellus comscasis]|nr:LytTR family DNA-binding domain-containing protein [Maribellus comscasis]
MTRFNAIIVDDEMNVRQTLEILLRHYCPDIRLCGSAESAATARQLLKAFEVHLIFLDISMPNENGFDFIASIPKEKYAIIFTTAHEEYALKAIKANAIDYLLKPINPSELKEAVDKATSFLNLRQQQNNVQNVYSESLENLLQQVKGENKQVKKITVVEKFGFRIVEVDTIRYLEADSNYTILHLSGLEKIISSKSLGEFEKVLDSNQFFRIHKSNIVNLNYLKGFSSYQGYFAVLDDGTKLPISRRRFNEFRELVGTHSKSID